MRRGALAALAWLALAAGCGEGDVGERRQLVEGDVANGLAVIKRADCAACHRIPGVPGPYGRVGPPLAGFAQRGYIAGQFPNRPSILVQWVRDAPALEPRTAMPDFDLSEREARDIAAYLYTLD